MFKRFLSELRQRRALEQRSPGRLTGSALLFERAGWAATLALMARLRREDGDPEGAEEIAVSEAQFIERARAEGWDDLAFANYSK